MASFNDLSLHIYRCIVYAMLDNRCYNLYQWKQKLPILGVCSLWRSIALPTLYRTAYVHDASLYKSLKVNYSPRVITKQNLNSRPHNPSLFKSNINLILSSGLCFLVKELVCSIQGNVSFLDLFAQLIHLLKPNISLWCNVHYLHMLITSHLDRLAANLEFESYCNSKLEDALQFIASNFTHVSRLHIDFREHSLFGEKIASGLLNMYAHKLQSLRCYSPTPAVNACLSPQLSSLTIRFDKINSDSISLYIFSKTLRDLDMRNVLSNFNWRIFQDQNSPYETDICFYQLEFLQIVPDIYYNECTTQRDTIHSSSYKPYYKLYFPKLEYLAILDSFDNCELVFANISGCLSKLTIAGDPLCLDKCKFLKSPYLTYLYLHLHIRNDHDVNSLYSLIRSISENCYQCLNSLKITINSSASSIDFKNITLPFCTDLILQCAMSFLDLYDYISSTLQLRVMKLHETSLYSIMDSVIPFDMIANNYTSDSNYSVERIYLWHNCEAKYFDNALLLVAYFLLYCRKLKYIQVYELLKPQIDRFVSMYKHVWPHIETPEVAYYLLVEDFAPPS